MPQGRGRTIKGHLSRTRLGTDQWDLDREAKFISEYQRREGQAEQPTKREVKMPKFSWDQR